jgi:pSer/pThr/pTyr-binding forkhead associated (FHA) protein
MRIEILVGLENPVFYPINTSKIVIGSDLSCDIVVAEDQISRKHLIVVQEEENYFVIDQGSTNGSYLNEERLIPGRRVEFTSYFPVRLGSSVLVSLVSDEEALDEVNKISIPIPGESSAPKKNPLSEVPKVPRSSEDKTTVISLRDLQKSNTGSMVKRREAYKKKVAERAKAEADPKKKKKKKVKKKKKFLEFYEIVALAILGVALYLTFTGEKEIPDNGSSPEELTTESKPVAEKPKKLTTPNFLELFELKSAKKCQTPDEIVICESLKLDDERWGTVEYKGQLVTLVDADKYFDHISQTLPEPKDYDPKTAEGEKRFQKELWELTVGWFLAKGFESDAYTSLEGKELVFALLTSDQGIYSVKASFVITPEKLKDVRRLTDEKRFNFIKVSRALIVNYFSDYFELNF